MLALCALQHLVVARIAVACEVSDIGDVHYTLNVIAREAQILLKNVLHDIAAQIADMRVVVNGRAAGVHTYLSRLVGNKLLLFMR